MLKNGVIYTADSYTRFKTKKSATDDLYKIILASKSTQKYQEIYR